MRFVHMEVGEGAAPVRRGSKPPINLGCGQASEHLATRPVTGHSKLESSYGAPLFVRNGAGVELSAYGSALYSRAVKVLPALDEAREEIEHLQGRAKAAIRIATGDLWGLVILPTITRQFALAHPDVVVHVEIADEGTRLQGLRDGSMTSSSARCRRAMAQWSKWSSRR